MERELFVGIDHGCWTLFWCVIIRLLYQIDVSLFCWWQTCVRLHSSTFNTTIVIVCRECRTMNRRFVAPTHLGPNPQSECGIIPNGLAFAYRIAAFAIPAHKCRLFWMKKQTLCVSPIKARIPFTFNHLALGQNMYDLLKYGTGRHGVSGVACMPWEGEKTKIFLSVLYVLSIIPLTFFPKLLWLESMSGKGHFIISTIKMRAHTRQMIQLMFNERTARYMLRAIVQTFNWCLNFSSLLRCYAKKIKWESEQKYFLPIVTLFSKPIRISADAKSATKIFFDPNPPPQHQKHAHSGRKVLLQFCYLPSAAATNPLHRFAPWIAMLI